MQYTQSLKIEDKTCPKILLILHNDISKMKYLKELSLGVGM